MAAQATLSALDAAFLYLERPTQLLHVGCVALLDGVPPFDELVDAIGQRLARLPRYREVPVRPRFDLGLPRWESDPHFTTRRHVRQVGLPAPGGSDVLARVVDTLLADPLPADRSPWEITLVSGLPNGRSALVTKVHHCMIDGVSGAQVLEVISDPHESRDTAPLASAPSAPRTLLDAVLGLFGRLDLHTLAELGSTLTTFVREPVSALPWNKPLSPARQIVWAGFDLADFLALRGAVGCKINDVVLAVVAGALRSYLLAHGVPTEGLRVRAAVPVSVRRNQDRLTLGNLVSAVFPVLPIDVDDPIDRLRRIAHEMNAIKTRRQAQATGLFLGMLASLPAPLEALLGRLVPDTALVNTICTNVPGPRERCTLVGVPIVDVHPFVPLFSSMGVEFAILSYADRLSISAAVDPTLVPDADTLPTLLTAALAELVRLLDPARVHGPIENATPSVRSLMSAPVLTVAPDDTVELAWVLMAHARIRHLPVVDEGGHLVGILTHRDVLGVAPSTVEVRSTPARIRRLAAFAIRDVMEPHVVVTTPDEPAAAAGHRMLAGKIGALPVVDSSRRVVGILTIDDLATWATRHMGAAA